MKSKNKTIALLLLVLLSPTLQNCASSKLSKSELQQRATTIAYNAQNISDADAAVACYDMLVATEKRLEDTTRVYHDLQKKVPSLERKARNKGVGIGVGIGLAIWLLLRI